MCFRRYNVRSFQIWPVFCRALQRQAWSWLGWGSWWTNRRLGPRSSFSTTCAASWPNENVNDNYKIVLFVHLPHLPRQLLHRLLQLVSILLQTGKSFPDQGLQIFTHGDNLLSPPISGHLQFCILATFWRNIQQPSFHFFPLQLVPQTIWSFLKVGNLGNLEEKPFNVPRAPAIAPWPHKAV